MATKYPPSMSTRESCKIIKEIFATTKSKDVAIDLLPNVFQVSPKSSYFPAKLATLIKFGLLDKKSAKSCVLTDLAMKIVNPIGDEIKEAKLVVFKKNEVLSQLLIRYPNGVLPSAEQVKATLRDEYGVDHNLTNAWYDFVHDSFEDIKESVNQNSTKQPDEPKTPPSGSLTEIKTPPVNAGNYQNIELPSGAKFYFHLDEGYSRDDLDFITDFFELKKKRVKS
jgi:hypothetical protein